MKAVVYRRYGFPDEVLALEEIDEPGVGDDGVLVRVEAAALNRLDWHRMTGLPYLVRVGSGLRRPKTDPTILGIDFSGRVEAIGTEVARFAPGDEVYGCAEFGALAEYVAVPEGRLERKPENLSFAQAAAVPFAAQAALQGLLDHGRVRPGHKVLVNGASGGVGTFAVQIAKAFGAEVTAVCVTKDLDRIRALGADHAIDYTRVDFTKQGRVYDVILDIAARTPVSHCRRALAANGAYVLVGSTGGRWIGGLRRHLAIKLVSPFVGQTLVSFATSPDRETLAFLTDMIEHWKVVPVMDRIYTLDDAAKAVCHLHEGHSRGKTVIDLTRTRGRPSTGRLTRAELRG